MTAHHVAPIARVTSFLREGTGWLGDPPEVHSITITDIGAVPDALCAPGSQFDWFCTLASCRFISECLPNGDGHPSVEAAERDAVAAHAQEGVPLDVHSARWVPAPPSGWDERPF